MASYLTLVLCILMTLASCGAGRPSQNSNKAESFEDIQKEAINALLDTATTAERLTEAMIQYGECLKIAASNPDNIDMRVDAQRRSLFTIQLLLEKIDQMDSLGREVSPAQIKSCFSSLVDALSIWCYAEDDIGPRLFKEVYYNSYQDSKDPVPGYFQITVYLPTEKNPEPAVGIVYPQTAQSNPLIFFTKDEVNGAPADGWDNQEFIGANVLELKNANGDGTPMNDFYGPDFLEKMLNNEHMYMMFSSESPAAGVPGDLEVARMDLRSFHEKYSEIMQ